MSSKNGYEKMSTLLCIEGELTVFRAAELRGLLLSDSAPQTLNLAGVTEFDTAGLQLLIAAKRSALAANRPLNLEGHSPAMMEVFNLLNVAHYFDEPLEMEVRK